MIGGLGLLLAVLLAVMLVRSWREARAYQDDEPETHEQEDCSAQCFSEHQPYESLRKH